MSVQETTILTSWKEVAAYLGKGVRTVQRWELRLGLPVRRPEGVKHGIIQVSREELDSWLDARWSHRPDGASPPVDAEHLIGASIETSRELRAAQRQLLGEVRNTLLELAIGFHAIENEMKRSGAYLEDHSPLMETPRSSVRSNDEGVVCKIRTQFTSSR